MTPVPDQTPHDAEFEETYPMSETTAATETGAAESSTTRFPSAGPADTAPPTPERARGTTPWWRSTRAVTVVAIIGLVAAAVFATLWATDDSAGRLAELQGRLDTEAAAESVASDYAMAVSAVDHDDLDGWRDALTAGVSDQLAPKLEAAVDVVGPWLTRMEYTSTARLLAAEVSESDGDTFVVQVFVDMTSRSRQTPEGVAATATYTVTMDRASDWTITDVGGVGAGLPGAGDPGTQDNPGAGAAESGSGGR